MLAAGAAAAVAYSRADHLFEPPYFDGAVAAAALVMFLAASAGPWVERRVHHVNIRWTAHISSIASSFLLLAAALGPSLILLDLVPLRGLLGLVLGADLFFCMFCAWWLAPIACLIDRRVRVRAGGLGPAVIVWLSAPLAVGILGAGA